MSIKIYGVRAGNSLRAVWTLEELNLEHEVVMVNLKEQEHKKEEFLKLNPAGQVPVLVDGEFIVSESMAISRYLANKYGQSLLGKSPEEGARIEQWSLFTILNIQKHFSEIMGQKWSGKNDEAIINPAKEKLARDLPLLDNYLADKDYISGGEFSIGDINAGTTMISYSGFAEYDYSEYKNITKWITSLLARPALQKARAEMK